MASTLSSRDESVGVHEYLVSVGSAGQSTGEELCIADALAPNADGIVEVKLSIATVFVVVQLHPHVIKQLDNVKGCRGVQVSSILEEIA